MGDPIAPDHLGPVAGEAAALSLVVVRDSAAWVVACGSLLTVPASVARTSWSRWDEQQPRRGAGYDPGGFDLGPVFWAEPFADLRIVRFVVEPSEWPQVVSRLGNGGVDTPFARCNLRAGAWSSTLFLGQGGLGNAFDAIVGVQRPVTGVIAELEHPAIPPTDDTWAWPLPPGLQPGPVLGDIAPRRRLLHWPIRLLGINWLGHPDHPPPPAFVVGRTLHEAWITEVKPDYEAGELGISIGWDAKRIDPLSCTLVVRNEVDGIPALMRHIRVSDLPSRPQAESVEPRSVTWTERTLDIGLPHGPRRSDWGTWLFSHDGRLLDERPAVPRCESVSISITVGSGTAPAREFTVGDRQPPPTAGERDEAVQVAIDLERQARVAAAQRRMSTSGDVRDYLRWRFSCRVGELLVCDPWLLGNEPQAAIAFLKAMERPVRALAGGVPNVARPHLSAAPEVDVRPLPDGRKVLHDRVWLVGETGLLVGTSLNDLVASIGAVRATTATELPHADAAAWREQFETWWARAKAPFLR